MRFPVQVRSFSGFTLIELLIVVSMITILSGFMIPGFSNYLNTQNIRQAQEILKSDLRTIQNKALTGVSAGSGEYWGLKINSDNAPFYYYFVSGGNDQTACNGAPTTERSTQLPGDVVITNGSTATCVFFSFKNGDAAVVGAEGNTIKVGYITSTTCSGVTINDYGLIYSVDELACN